MPIEDAMSVLKSSNNTAKYKLFKCNALKCTGSKPVGLWIRVVCILKEMTVSVTEEISSWLW